MVLTEQQKKDLVERLKNGREKKAKEIAKVEKVAKKAVKEVKEIPFEEPLPTEPIKVQKKTKAVATKAVKIIPFEEPLLTPRIVESSESELEPIDEHIDEPVEQIKLKPSTLKDKKNKNKNKFLTIKFHQQPTSEFYKKVISSIQPDEPPKSYSYENLPDKVVKITDEEKAETERKIKEVQMRDLIYRTLG
jgi:hypothetical protein